MIGTMAWLWLMIGGSLVVWYRIDGYFMVCVNSSLLFFDKADGCLVVDGRWASCGK